VLVETARSGGAMSYTTRKRLALLVLVVGLPLYIVVAVNLVELLGRPPIVIELLIYVVLGIVWALPFKALFRGLGRADPDEPRGDGR
jgi:hypothetical protein